MYTNQQMHYQLTMCTHTHPPMHAWPSTHVHKANNAHPYTHTSDRTLTPTHTHTHPHTPTHTHAHTHVNPPTHTIHTIGHDVQKNQTRRRKLKCEQKTSYRSCAVVFLAISTDHFSPPLFSAALGAWYLCSAQHKL